MIFTNARNWVITHSREQILNLYERLSNTRKLQHAEYLRGLENHSVYMQFEGHPPIHPNLVRQLEAKISEARSELRRDIDADWRASVLWYPDILDYYYSLTKLQLPDESSRWLDAEKTEEQLRARMHEKTDKMGSKSLPAS